ncbi:outer membrane protein assembly factor BamA [Poriferisphaera sp. WC338]|uniref:outer membrane protein assembly factor BamA n=1 Tax=Poriferisphaera sp. WC338 TaxID=3425129 RepID=UPI003D813026
MIIVFQALMLLAGSTVAAQGIEPEHRPIADISVSGLRMVPEQLVLNQVRSAVGRPYNSRTVTADIRRINNLGRFSYVAADVKPNDDGSVNLIFNVTEQPLLADVQIVGNKALSDGELLNLVRLRAGDPADEYLIERGQRQIMDAYEAAGYFVAQVSIDRELLADSGILIYQVREGPHVRIRGFRFEGNTIFPDKQLRNEIKSKIYFPIFRKGELNRQQLQIDAAAIRDFYRDNGYLDADAAPRISLSPDERDAVVVFIIKEGPQYLVSEINVEGVDLFTKQQILENIELVPGDIYTQKRNKDSAEVLRNMYGKLGYLETQVSVQPIFHEDQPRVDVSIGILEGQAYTVGKVIVTGNDTTKSKVVLRQVYGMKPGYPFDRTGFDETQKRLRASPLFSDGTVTILGDRQETIRDVLVEVKEGDTGSLGFGAGVTSDSGVIGSVNLIQRNFDITDTPDSLGEFFSGRAFKGAGQYFSIDLQPGNETQRYAASFREPYFFETDYFFDSTAFYFSRVREDWDEARAGGNIGIGQRFGDVWSAQAILRAEDVEITGVDVNAPVDVFDVEGSNLIDSIGVRLQRRTTNSIIFPTRGTNFDLTVEQFGILGDFEFTRIRAKYNAFWTVDEDFLGRKTVVSLRTDIGNIFGSAPTFERFYAGGFRSFRGFEFRGVGPRGVPDNSTTGEPGEDPVGGNFMWLVSLQYEVPIWDRYLRGVVFTDQGTVQETAGLDQWRVAVGAGVRFQVPFLSQAPFAVDFGIPLVKQDGDQTQLIAFDIAIPLQ